MPIANFLVPEISVTAAQQIRKTWRVNFEATADKRRSAYRKRKKRHVALLTWQVRNSAVNIKTRQIISEHDFFFRLHHFVGGSVCCQILSCYWM